MTTFMEMDESGKIVKSRTISRENILRCPMVILLSAHYREDGTCRCDEPNCEFKGCSKLKFEEEIYCEEHC